MEQHQYLHPGEYSLTTSFSNRVLHSILNEVANGQSTLRDGYPQNAGCFPVYLIYLLHQVIIIGSGYVIVQWSLPLLLKVLLLLLVCFGSFFLLYHFLIKRFVPTNVVYGFAPKENRAVKAPVVSTF